MHKKTLNTFLSRGFPTDLIEKIDKLSFTYSALNGISIEALMKIGFEEEEANIIYSKTGRKPIKKEVVKSLIEKSGGCCCYCKNGINSQPYQIHHIEEYHISQNNEESNLIVVCPNHHVVIHSKSISDVEQIIKKNEWENLWQIAKEFQKKNLTYPFKSFSLVDYTQDGDISEIFSFSIPSGNLCKLLTTGSLANNACEILNETNMLILTGASGCGKSTFALGVAGKLQGYTVFKYEPKKVNNIEEIFNLISLNIEETILVIDDANFCFSSNEIENILKATNKSFKIIVTFSTGTMNEQVENHFTHNTIFLSWPAIEIACKEYFLSNEDKLLNYLNENNLNRFDNDVVGYSFPYISLQNLFDRFSNRVDKIKTTWEFIYLLSNGYSKIDNISIKLFAEDRFDVVVFFSSINQISNSDSGASISEIQSFYRENNILNQTPEPEKEWLLNILEKQCLNRVLKSDRGRYKTIHRKFAQSFIDLFAFKYPNDAKNILFPYLDKQEYAKPVVMLWSWLKSTSAKFLIHEWFKHKGADFYAAFILKCANEDFAILSVFISLIEPSIRRQPAIIQKLFASNIEAISNSINCYSNSNFYFHNEFFRILKQNTEPVAYQLFDKIDIDVFVSKIKSVSPSEYYNLKWLFNSLLEINPDKVIEIANKLSFTDCIEALKNVELGNISNIDEVVGFYRTYILRLKRSKFHDCIQIIIEKLSMVAYSNLKFPHFFSGLFELPYFKTEMVSILESLDYKRLSFELISCNPRNWNNIGTLFLYVNMYYSQYSEKFIDLIDSEKLGENISKYYKLDRYNFRCLLHVLSYASEKKREEFATMLLPLLEDLFKDSQNNHEFKEILGAFYKVDKNEALRLSQEIQINIESSQNERKELPDIKDGFISGALKTDYLLDDTRFNKN